MMNSESLWIIESSRNESLSLICKAIWWIPGCRYHMADELAVTNPNCIPRREVAQYNQKAYAFKPGLSKIGPVIVLVLGIGFGVWKFWRRAIQIMDRGLIVGRRSFGKGFVQCDRPLWGAEAFRIDYLLDIYMPPSIQKKKSATPQRITSHLHCIYRSRRQGTEKKKKKKKKTSPFSQTLYTHSYKNSWKVHTQRES